VFTWFEPDNHLARKEISYSRPFTTGVLPARVVSAWLCMCSVGPVATRRSTWLDGSAGSGTIELWRWLPMMRQLAAPGVNEPFWMSCRAEGVPGSSTTDTSSIRASPASSNPITNSFHRSGPMTVWATPR
jgi:hypothetical protein